MALIYQIPRNCLVALLLSQVAVLAPHLLRLPLWVTAVCLVCALWRLVLYTGRGFYPSGVLKSLLLIIAGGAIFKEYGNLYSLEPIVALLITTSALKLIEMKSRRDVLVVIYLAYFVAATHFLFEQGLLDALYTIFAATLITSALICLHQSDTHKGPAQAVWKSSRLLLQAVPLTIVMFIVFPRIGPLWSVPGAESGATTGPSDSMGPGDISNLARSSDLAFRVSFDGPIPSPSKLYWRGLVFSDFDGRRWRQWLANDSTGKISQEIVDERASEQQRRGDPLSYTVTLEASQQPWLYAIALASAEQNFGDVKVLPGLENTLRSRKAIEQRYQYRVQSWLDYTMDQTLSAAQRTRELSLPDGFNPRTLAFAQEMRRKYAEPAVLLRHVLAHFHREEFIYTLKPPRLGRHSVDEFMFDTRRGFCEHYASSFVVLMRAAGVPARVVVGYQGGEVNPFEKYLLVHEFDAHAWAEVWLQGQGWVRVDPTAAVAPNRIEAGISDVLADEMGQQSTLPLIQLRQLPMLRWARLRWDSVNYSWTHWVLNYDSELQLSVLEDWMGEVTGWRIAGFVLGSGGLVLGLIALNLLRQRVRHKLHPIDKTYLLHSDHLAKAGLIRSEGEGVQQFASRVAEKYPQHAELAIEIASLYSELRYNHHGGVNELSQTRSIHEELKKRVRQFARDLSKPDSDHA